MLYLSEERVGELLRWDELIATMGRALADFSLGRVLQPVRNMLTIEEGKRYLGIMPAVAEAAMGAKLVSFYPGNAGTGLPTHMAMVLLLRPDTGEPLAVMDGRLITEMRTAAVSAAATRHLAAPDSRILALLGSGVQADAHLQALRQVCSFADIRVWSRTPSMRRALPTGTTRQPCRRKPRYAAPTSSSPRPPRWRRSSRVAGSSRARTSMPSGRRDRIGVSLTMTQWQTS